MVWSKQTYNVIPLCAKSCLVQLGGGRGGEKGCFAVHFPAVEDLIFLSLSRMRETSQKVLGYLWSSLHFNLYSVFFCELV